MRRFAWVAACALVSLPAAGRADPPELPRVVDELLHPEATRSYKAPKPDGPVVELLDEGIEPFLPVLTNDDARDPSTVAREDRDVYSGVQAARVTLSQRFRSRIPGWDFRVVETPAKAGEFRYLRFAWKKVGGTGIMIQLFDPARGGWSFRYFAGQNVAGWSPATRVAPRIPDEWELVTRDLFKDFGAFTVTGLALTAFNGEAALFDHMLLGRTVEDLDRATDAALGRVKPAKAPAGKERESLWADLMGENRARAAAAQRALLATAADHVGFVGEQLAKAAPDKARTARLRRLLRDLDADAFDDRDRATDELVRLGGDAAEAVRALAARPPNDEVAYRTRLILRKLNAPGLPVGTAGRTVRAVRVLERADTVDARALLEKLAEGEFGFEVVPDAKAALARLAKKP